MAQIEASARQGLSMHFLLSSVPEPGPITRERGVLPGLDLESWQSSVTRAPQSHAKADSDRS